MIDNGTNMRYSSAVFNNQENGIAGVNYHQRL